MSERGATSTTIERFFVFDGRHTTEDGEEVRCVLHGKESLLFTKYPALLNLNLTMELTWAQAYHTPDSAKTFTSYIAKSFNSDTQSDED